MTTLEEEEYPPYYWSRGVAGSRGSGATLTGESDASEGGLAAGDGRALGEARGAAASSPETLTEESPSPSPVPSSVPALFEGHRDSIENQRGVSYESLLLPYLRGAAVIELHDPYIRMGHQGRNLVELLALVAAKDPGGHDRWISTDTGWRINLGRGLDIFQKSDGGWFDLGTSRQEFR